MKYLFLIIIFSVNVFAQSKDEKGNELGLLAFSKNEVENIRDIIGGKIILDKYINKTKLLKDLEKYDIIHLATHTQIDNKNPLLSRFFISTEFDSTNESNSIFASDILTLQLSAKMVVLSSCNTGTGKILKGEGIMSLARAFKFAGSPSVIMSLWEIDDISTSTIMKGFYTGLKKGKQKDVALRDAKLAYLNRSNSKSAAPVFWAGTVPIGNLEKLNFKNVSWFPGNLLFIFIAILLFVSVFYFVRKKNYFL
ncbi:MAG TPA: CHAT domain-containing protein [Ignavibacteria bacterium]|nr:CHAT domain-containing protein [Ignavibacteria bacterium]